MPPTMPMTPPMMMGAQGAPRVPTPGPTGPAGVGVQNEGNAMRGKVLAGIAMTFLDQALSMLSSKTDEGQAVLKMLSAGSKFFGPPPKELGAQELKLAAARMNPMQGPAAGPSPMPNVMNRAAQLGIAPPPQGAPQGAAA